MSTSETRGVMAYVDEEKNLHIHYPVTEGGIVTFDNTGTGLTADNVEDAIKELAASGHSALALPAQSGTLTYTGSELAPTWDNYDPDTMTLGGTASATDAGTYEATFTPKDGYRWLDDTSETKAVTWTIGRASVAAVPAQSGMLTYSGSAQSPSWSNYDSAKLTIGGTTSGTDAGSYDATFTPGGNYQWSDGGTGAKTVTWSIGKATGSLSLNKSSLSFSAKTAQEITVTRAGDGAITAKSSDTNVATISVSGTTVTVTPVKDGNAIVTVSVAEGTNYTAPSDKTCSVTIAMPHIYGASWDGTSTTAWTRTDEAADFVDPVPYVKDATAYSSPFDSLQPWAGMTRVTDETVGELVKIPKFWYKVTQNNKAITVQIADRAVTGYSVSPAHMDRGDGSGERDVVYIGRYHCGATAYKSASGQKPKVSITRSTARSAISALGSDIWQADFAMRFTLWLLYIVEFANWDSQSKIGYGCGNNSAVENCGASDSMPYHTGTMQTSRTTYGVGTQYRYIEGLWDNCLDWCDGCYNSSAGLNIILDPSDFSDRSGGTSIGTPSSGYPSAFGVSSAAGFPMFYPTAADGDTTTYSCDDWSFAASGPCLFVGGYYYRGTYCGLFCVGGSSASPSGDYIGCRLQKLP